MVFERGPNNWSAYVPDLPGCIATAKNRAELETLIREAIKFHIEGLKEDGLPIPPPASQSELIEIAA